MPGRKYKAGATSSYRYSINGQEKEPELNENITTAQFWEYDSRIGRRWNRDPINKSFESPYTCLANSPIWLGDQNGADTTIQTLNSGQSLNIPDGSTAVVETYDVNNTYTVGNKQLKLEQAGVLRSVTVDGVKYAANWNEDGSFAGYLVNNDKNQNLSTAWKHDVSIIDNPIRRSIAGEVVNTLYTIWRVATFDPLQPSAAQPNSKSSLGQLVDMVAPVLPFEEIGIFVFRKVAPKTLGPLVTGASEYLGLMKPQNEFDVVKTLYRGTTGSEVGSTTLFLTDDAGVAATYVLNGGQVMQYEISNYALQSLKFSGEMTNLTGIKGATGKISTEYMFNGKNLVEAVNSLATPLK